MFEIEMYAKGNGEVPLREHIDDLPPKMQIKILQISNV